MLYSSVKFIWHYRIFLIFPRANGSERRSGYKPGDFVLDMWTLFLMFKYFLCIVCERFLVNYKKNQIISADFNSHLKAV